MRRAGWRCRGSGLRRPAELPCDGEGRVGNTKSQGRDGGAAPVEQVPQRRLDRQVLEGDRQAPVGEGGGDRHVTGPNAPAAVRPPMRVSS
ncbi:hypothetical protein GCM10027610_074140 [Dactylosporangium cerinum]